MYVYVCVYIYTYIWLPWWLSDKKSDTGSIPGSGRSPGEGNGYTLQCSCLGNPMDREAWQATVHGVAKEFGHNLMTKHTGIHI